MYIRHQRYEYTLKRLTEFWKEGNIVFSPIIHCYDASNKYDLPKDYTFWQRIDRHMIDNSDEVWVLKMEDDVGSWSDSKGITDEVQYAERLGKKVVYFDCNEYGNY